MKHIYDGGDKICLREAIAALRKVQNRIETDQAEMERLDTIIYSIEDVIGEDE